MPSKENLTSGSLVGKIRRVNFSSGIENIGTFPIMKENLTLEKDLTISKEE